MRGGGGREGRMGEELKSRTVKRGEVKNAPKQFQIISVVIYSIH
jgi:hypothetical protein